MTKLPRMLDSATSTRPNVASERVSFQRVTLSASDKGFDMSSDNVPRDSSLHGIKDYPRPVEIHNATTGQYMFTVTAPAGESIHEAITKYGTGYMAKAEWSDPFRFRFPDGEGGYYSRYIVVGVRG